MSDFDPLDEYSKQYQQLMEDAKTRFRTLLEGLPKLKRWNCDRTLCIDCLPDELREQCLEIGKQIAENKPMELSYRHLCDAFLAVSDELGFIEFRQEPPDPHSIAVAFT